MTLKTDVLIIGGGAIGLSTAYYLLKAGRDVTVIDQKAVAAGSSSGNAGHIVPSHIVPLAAPGIIGTALGWMLDPKNSPFGMRVSVDPAYLSWLLAFAGACSEANVASAIPALKALGLLPTECAMLGDQIFTDVFGANRLGIFSIYLKNASPIEQKWMRVVRRLEKWIVAGHPADHAKPLHRHKGDDSLL